MADALFMAQDAIEMWLWDTENKREMLHLKAIKYTSSPDAANVVCERMLTTLLSIGNCSMINPEANECILL